MISPHITARSPITYHALLPHPAVHPCRRIGRGHCDEPAQERW